MKKTTIIGPLSFFATLVFIALTAGASMAANPLLDQDSIECLSCHDASLATDTTIVTVCPDPGCDHPIGVDYLISSSMNPSLKPSYLLDPAMQLPGNRISCVTCHVPYSAQNHSLLSSMRTNDPQIPDPMLSVSNLGSGLCMECHKK